ncbi:nickel/cobalt efflux protein RcnA [Photobacterium malacitanum]|uniref:Nickel/cobalt efflux system n=1 Tax=Photobacterium malacitanum TaxID=2204294 RepID=A0A1Y6MI95_9GAMM|nr:nickel/cobalt transporter [Photobacterium malacitanum]SMY36274.1 nickel/cobalt efflux protein RcnA [Photobacterium malacitanum]
MKLGCNSISEAKDPAVASSCCDQHEPNEHHHRCEHHHLEHNHDGHSATCDHHHSDISPAPISWLTRTIVLLLFLGSGYYLWLQWPAMLMTSIKWQRDINGQLSDLLYDAQQNITAAYSLAGLSFLYGIFHSLGPGHGKMIVTTYLATNPAKIKASLIMTVVSAFVQAIVAITLVSILLVFFKSSMRQVNDAADQFISYSFMAMLLLGAIVIYRSLKQAWQLRTAQHHHHHDHGDNCGCGHKHFANADEINNATSLREYIVIVFSIGIRPCTGAILVLLFANMVGLYWLGVISAILMAVGTALTTSGIALLTLSGKKIVSRYLATNQRQRTMTSIIIKLIGGILLVLLGLLLLNGHSYGMSPVL